MGRIFALVLGLAAAAAPGAASASTTTTLGAVDFIDHVFGAGGGSYTKSLTGGADDGWSVFAANAGDTLSVTFSASTGTSGAPAAYDGAVMLELSDGIVAVGDLAGITNFSFDRTGAGTDLVVQHPGFNPFPTGSYQFGSGSTQSVTFAAAATGQYAIGVSCTNESCVNGSTFTVQLSGNTAALPAPGAGSLLGLGLALLAGHRSRRPSRRDGERVTLRAGPPRGVRPRARRARAAGPPA
jgi:hypothetical protein